MIKSALALLALTALPLASAQSTICYDYYGRPYYCSGISYGARIGIGLGVAAGVLLLVSLCMYWRRRNLRNQWSKFRPPALPTSNNYGNSANPYANNPPPPQGYHGQSSFNNNAYGNGPNPPAQTYQPSMAGQYGGYGGRDLSQNNVNKPETGTGNEGDHEHGYEWQQAREAERLEREQGHGVDAPPPGYDVSTAATTPQNTGGYAPPPGAPPAGKIVTQL